MWWVLTRTVAIGCTALAVKIVDDALDRELDLLRGRPGLTATLEEASAAYVGILVVLAALLSLHDAVSLFAAAYIWGMVKAPGVLLPWGGRAWQESVLVALVVGAGLGPWPLITALLSLGAVQFLDDLIDEHPCHNGEWLWLERAALAVVLLLIAGYIDVVKVGAVLASSGTLWFVELRACRGGGERVGRDV